LKKIIRNIFTLNGIKQRLFVTAFCAVHIKIPANFEGEEVHFIWNSGNEALIYENDEPQQGKSLQNQSKTVQCSEKKKQCSDPLL
jgi:hypothetical protein